MQIENFDLTPEQRELEKALAGMAPTAAGIDRDALMFAAGEAAALARLHHPMVWPWRVAACVGLSLSVGLGVMAMRGPVPLPTEVVKAAPSLMEIPGRMNSEMGNEGDVMAAMLSVEATSESSPWSYYNLRNEALNWGVNVLPTAPNGGAGGAVVKEERVGKSFSFRQFIFNVGGRS